MPEPAVDFEGSDLRDKVAIVTGGAGGLGSATVRALAEAGARVLVTDIDPAGATLAEQVDGAFLEADVGSLEANREMVAFAVERFGGLDHVFLNAGVSSGIGLGDDFEEARYREVMGINIDGVVFGAVAALPALRKRGGGSIVATASLAGLTSVPFDPIYAANKHAVVGLTRSLGDGLTAENIRFNAICPGFSESGIIAPFRDELIASGTPIIPAENVAATVLKLFRGEMSGECWFVQAGRDSDAFAFRNIPGPRAPA